MGLRPNGQEVQRVSKMVPSCTYLRPIAVKIELSSLRSIQSKSRYGCAKCLRGYHVACFNVVHYPSAFHASTPSVTRALGAIRSAANGEAPAKTRRRLKLEDLEVAQ
ncbi:hypothetical protein JG688_00011096 [Phytophthora aleatoria]|uniref:Uncharacterized protein n=1 Tax=Phytophthora aleatoria TaxID=2496075 RepID=A0A8J5J4D2_9STRA|nr:hypothetical protein JG688_00011096 [Phytophthora aleatoria]